MRVLTSLETGFPDPAAWDYLVASHPEGHLLQTWAWGALKGDFGWAPVRVAIEQDGALVAGAQALYRRLGPICMAYIPKGPAWLEDTPDVAEALLRALQRVSLRMRAVTLKVEPEWCDGDAERHVWLRARGFQPSAECIQPRRTIVVDLTADEETILARMKPKWRYNVRLSERKGVTVRVGDAEDLLPFYRLMELTGQRDGFAVHNAAYYRRAWELFAPDGRAQLLLAEYEGELLAGILAYAFNRQAWYMYGASGEAHRERMPNHQLQWRAMQWARSLGCTQYDLWGITDTDEDSPTAALGGVERFKQGFGGEVVRTVGAYDHDYVASAAWLLRRAWTWRRSRAVAQG